MGSSEQPRQEAHPNLKKGNTVGVGRLRSEVRERYLEGADKGGEQMAKVAAGERCIRVEGRRGGAAFRFPTFAEIALATKICAEYGLGTQKEVSGPNGGPIPVQTSAPDLSALSIEEKEALYAMLAKAEADKDE